MAKKYLVSKLFTYGKIHVFIILRESEGCVMTADERFMKKAIELAALAVEHGNQPFGAILVKNGEMVCTNENQIYTATDPTFHAEAGLIRRFCKETGITDLSEYTMYSSCEPCFMCCGAMVWVKLGRLVYGASDEDLSKILGKKEIYVQILYLKDHPGNRR